MTKVSSEVAMQARDRLRCTWLHFRRAIMRLQHAEECCEQRCQPRPRKYHLQEEERGVDPYLHVGLVSEAMHHGCFTTLLVA